MADCLSPDRFVALFAQCKSRQFSGQLAVTAARSGDNKERIGWQFYFALGRLFWADGGTAPNRRLQSILFEVAPQLKSHKFAMRRVEPLPCDGYNSIWVLIKREILEPNQFGIIVEKTMSIAYFDLFQQTRARSVDYGEQEYDPLEMLRMSPLPIDADRIWRDAQQSWQVWSEAGLENYSPDHLLKISNPQGLQAKTSPATYQNLVTAIDGNRTVRDLATLVRKTPLTLLKTLSPYLGKGLIELTPPKDFGTLAVSVPANTLPRRATKRSEAGRTSDRPPRATAAATPQAVPILCVDDSLQVCRLMEKLLTELGYGPVCIQDSTQALIQAISSKPKLIFLDLIMPVANGYEICAQIRRIAGFKEIPIIILTGQDGLIDRVRAKVVGATDFIAKPVELSKIKTILQKYLPHSVA